MEEEENRKERRVQDKADVICSKSRFLTAHVRAYCSEETLEIQLKGRTQGTDEILNITMQPLSWIRGKALSPLHCPLSSIPAILTCPPGDAALFT